MTLSEKLKTYRKVFGLSQRGLARQLGMSLYTVSLWERGKFSPSEDSAAVLQELFAEMEAKVEAEPYLAMDMTGEMIWELATCLNLTQKELAEKIGTSQQTVGRWMQGNRHPSGEASLALKRLYARYIKKLKSGLIPVTPPSRPSVIPKRKVYKTTYVPPSRPKIRIDDSEIRARRLPKW